MSQAPELAQMIARLGIDQASWEPAAFYPHGRGRRNERLRPELDDLLPVAAQIAEWAEADGWSCFHPEEWAGLPALTEATWVERAMGGQWPAVWHPDDGEHWLVCRPNLDVHIGRAGWHREGLGNLRDDGVEVTLGRALAKRIRLPDDMWHDPDVQLPMRELATRHGNAIGHTVHFQEQSVRYLWLDRERMERCRGRRAPASSSTPESGSELDSPARG